MSLRAKTSRIVVLVSAAALAASFSPGQEVDPGAPTIFVGGPAALDVSRAARDAVRRLREPACQRVLDDFTDREGRPLRESAGGLDSRCLPGPARPAQRRDPRGIGALRVAGRGGLHHGRGRGLRLRHELSQARPGRSCERSHPRDAPHPRPAREPPELRRDHPAGDGALRQLTAGGFRTSR